MVKFVFFTNFIAVGHEFSISVSQIVDRLVYYTRATLCRFVSHRPRYVGTSVTIGRILALFRVLQGRF